MNLRIITLSILIFGLVAGPVYAKKDKAGKMPPGLQKKAAMGKPLPPGWEKKLNRGQILDITIYNRGRIITHANNPKGTITIEVEGKTIRLVKATLEIVDILKD